MKKLLQTTLLVMALVAANRVQSQAQLAAYCESKEKVYIHTNHVFFKPGETVFFKIYLVNAVDQTPSKLSPVVMVDMLGPSGNVLVKMQYQVINGNAEGSYDFGAQIPGGIYTIRAYTTWMKNEAESFYYSKELTVQQVIAPRLLMKLDFPKKGYGAGEEVIADFSLRNLADEPIRFYDASYKVSIGGVSVSEGSFKTNKEGKYQIVFRLPQTLASSDGLLNITVNYDSYTESISRSIPIILKNIDLQFMPEGGSLVNGLQSWVAFRAVDEHGKPADISGLVKDGNGNTVSSFQAFRFGMGKFQLKPEAGQKYYAVITTPSGISGQFALPEARPDGVVMSMAHAGEKLQLTIQASRSQEVILRGMVKNKLYHSQAFSLRKGSNTFQVDPVVFPTGIAQFTLYTDGEMPLAERLVFVNENRVLQVKLTTEKEKYLPREKVSLLLQTTNEKGEPVPADLSLSVLDDKLWTYADDKQDHILSWLLMSSELKGKIEEPIFYFKKDEPQALPALDLVMLTHGYRYFDFIEYVNQNQQLKFTPDEMNMLGGVVMDKNKNPLRSEVFITDIADTSRQVKSMKTGDDGQFYFSGLKPGHSYYLFSRTGARKEAVDITITQNGIGYNPLATSILKKRELEGVEFAVVQPGAIPDVLQFIPVAVANDEVAAHDMMPQLGNKPAMLNEVVVVGFAANRQRKELGFSVTKVRAEDLNNIVNLQNGLAGKVAGLNVVEYGNVFQSPNITIRGIRSLNNTESPLIVVNGIPVDKLDDIHVTDIENVTVLKDATATAIFGSRASAGAILIESKQYRNGGGVKLNLTGKINYSSKQVYAIAPNYTLARKFYYPKYQSTETPERSDFRETIYWNPEVQTDEKGEARLEWYNSDATTTFRIIAEGIGYNGQVGRAEKTYSAQPALSADVKIPPYLTVGDQAMLPLVIKNNQQEPADIQVDLQLPENLETPEGSISLQLEGGESQQVLIPVTAKGIVNGNISFKVMSRGKSENLVLPITASEKGFPMRETISGNNAMKANFNISSLIPGSLKAELKLFDKPEGQLLDGIESMLQEPSGCFEQTSSTTYPNVFILKYLKQSGRSNPDIEQKALGFIRRGYDRLIGYETAENGFECFGKTPAHEALTAYGLLEFTDMKEFIPVDQRMLDRTKKFLLSRRDGKGSFHIASGGYDRFASVPNKIAGLYIVYALSQAGIGNEIREEYTTAVKQAMESNDGYQLGLMALAADNMKNDKDYAKLLELLNNSYKKLDLKSETSVVNSRDMSLRIETKSLYALALLRQANPDLITVSAVISSILSEKTYYGYGSTQATVFALNAIVEYLKKTGEASEKSAVTFSMNNNVVQPGLQEPGKIKEGANTFSAAYSNNKSKIPYAFEVSYQTTLPPNSDKAELHISTSLAVPVIKTGETNRMTIAVKNEKQILQPMVIAKIGIPAGLGLQPWQLKEIMEKNEVAYYEIFDNYLVLYWMGFAPGETKTIGLDLKAEIPGSYTAKASTVYLYYTPEYKHWNAGLPVKILPAKE